MFAKAELGEIVTDLQGRVLCPEEGIHWCIWSSQGGRSRGVEATRLAARPPNFERRSDLEASDRAHLGVHVGEEIGEHRAVSDVTRQTGGINDVLGANLQHRLVSQCDPDTESAIGTGRNVSYLAAERAVPPLPSRAVQLPLPAPALRCSAATDRFDEAGSRLTLQPLHCALVLASHRRLGVDEILVGEAVRSIPMGKERLAGEILAWAHDVDNAHLPTMGIAIVNETLQDTRANNTGAAHDHRPASSAESFVDVFMGLVRIDNPAVIVIATAVSPQIGEEAEGWISNRKMNIVGHAAFEWG